jgi:Arc/MetJ family transcription regulator
MRTTIAVDDHLLVAAKLRARERGQTLGQLVEDALRRELSEPTGSPHGRSRCSADAGGSDRGSMRRRIAHCSKPLTKTRI